MDQIQDYINSGILQSYVLGLVTPEEASEVEKNAAEHPDIVVAINAFSEQLEMQARSRAVSPPASVKLGVMATLDYMERMMKGEKPSVPPVLNDDSKIADYAEWLERPDMVINEDFRVSYARIIGYTPGMTTAIVWMDELTGEEHSNEMETFLVVEGSCEFTLGADVYKLWPGDIMRIPLYKIHSARTTSAFPCKLILQRIAV